MGGSPLPPQISTDGHEHLVHPEDDNIRALIEELLDDPIEYEIHKGSLIDVGKLASTFGDLFLNLKSLKVEITPLIIQFKEKQGLTGDIADDDKVQLFRTIKSKVLQFQELSNSFELQINRILHFEKKCLEDLKVVKAEYKNERGGGSEEVNSNLNQQPSSFLFLRPSLEDPLLCLARVRLEYVILFAQLIKQETSAWFATTKEFGMRVSKLVNGFSSKVKDSQN